MTVEVAALRARLTGLEEENVNLKQQIREEVQEEYEGLIQALFATCLHIKETLGGNQLDLIQAVCGLIGEQTEALRRALAGSRAGSLRTRGQQESQQVSLAVSCEVPTRIRMVSSRTVRNDQSSGTHGAAG
ncbi:Sentrin-specific protease 2 [Manis javanica]|nr:Sentrin-specific protease 2 [Manis javanica]